MASSAAARVFGVTELLEKILMHVAHVKTVNVRIDPGKVGRGMDNDLITCAALKLFLLKQVNNFVPAAAIELFPLERVNRTFNWTIQGSKKLTSLMFLNYLPTSAGHGAKLYQQYAPVIWLLHYLHDKTDAVAARSVRFQAKGSDKGYFEPRLLSELRLRVGNRGKKEDYITSHADTGASWRSMKTSIVADAEPAVVCVNLSYRWSRDAPVRSFKIEASETLGEFFDKYAKAYARAKRECEARQQAAQQQAVIRQAAAAASQQRYDEDSGVEV